MKNLIGRIVWMTAFLLMGGAALLAQEKQNPYKGLPFKDRITLGGDVGLAFGTYTYIRLAPRLGYLVSDRFTVGAGPSYTYYNDSRYTPAFETSIYGGSVFAQYFVLESIFLHTEFEGLNLEVLKPHPLEDRYVTSRTTIPIWFVGGGFSERTAGGSGFFVSVLYDLIQDPYSPYPNNLSIRVGGFFGL